MSSIALLLLLGPQKPSPTAEIDGAWVDSKGRTAFFHKEAFSWNADGVYYQARLATMPDGTLRGPYVGGRELLYETATNGVADRGVDLGTNALWPDRRTLATPDGETHILFKSFAARRPAVLQSEVTTSGGRSVPGETYFRELPASGLSMEGRFGDKDMIVEIVDPYGAEGRIKGTLAYLGRTFQLAGSRVMGKAAYLVFDPSRVGQKGGGYVVWEPSTDRAIDMRERRSERTDQIAFFFRLNDGSTSVGIHKVLRRLP